MSNLTVPDGLNPRFVALQAAIAPIAELIGTMILLKHSRGSRMSLRVQSVYFELSVPERVTPTEVRQFAESQIGWMRKNFKANTTKLSAAQANFCIELGAQDCIYLFGAKRSIVYEANASLVKLDSDVLTIGLDRLKSNAAQVRRLLSNYAVEQMYKVAMQEIKRVSELFGTRMYALSIKSMRSRWGSLAHDNRMSLNYALIFASIDCLQYVVCHELAHTLERNHSKHFWAHVARAMPSFKAHHETLNLQYESFMHLTQRLLERS